MLRLATRKCTRLPPQIPHASAPALLRRPSHHAHDLRAGVHVERVVVQQQVRVFGFQPDLLGVGVRRDDQRVDFNSRPSARGDECDSPTRETAEISIHAPPRGATGVISPLSSCVLFQFTPLREGRHKGAIKDGDKLIISIHAPPRGATAPCRGRSMFFSFQFTPLREGRPCGMSSVRAVIHFNSRPSARGDQARCWAYQPPVNFNSRPSARGDGQRQR